MVLMCNQFCLVLVFGSNRFFPTRLLVGFSQYTTFWGRKPMALSKALRLYNYITSSEKTKPQQEDKAKTADVTQAKQRLMVT